MTLQIEIDLYSPTGGAKRWSKSHQVAQPPGCTRGRVWLAFHQHHYSRLKGGLSARKILKIARSAQEIPTPTPPAPHTGPRAACKKSDVACQKQEKNVKTAMWQSKQRRCRRPKRAPAPSTSSSSELAAALEHSHAAATALPSAAGGAGDQMKEDAPTRPSNVPVCRREHVCSTCQESVKDRRRRQLFMGKAWKMCLLLWSVWVQCATSECEHPVKELCEPSGQSGSEFKSYRSRSSQNQERHSAPSSGHSSDTTEHNSGVQLQDDHLEGGAMRQEGSSRARAKRLTMYHQGERQQEFIPKAMTRAELEVAIPTRYALHPDWVTLNWFSDLEVEVALKPTAPK